MCQNLVPLVNIKIAGKWMFIPLKMVLIGIDPYPFMVQPLVLTKCLELPVEFPLHPILGHEDFWSSIYSYNVRPPVDSYPLVN